MAAPGFAPDPTTWNHSQVETTGQTRPETVETALRAAADFCATAGVHFGHRKMVRLVRAYLADRSAHQSFGAWVIAYADPTGETAVRNVMRATR